MIDPKLVLEPLETCDMVGLRVVSETKGKVLDHLLARHAMRQNTLISFFNSNFFVQSFRSRLNFSESEDFLFLNDGLAASLASKIYNGSTFADNLNGTDLIPSLLDRLPPGTRVFLYGAKPAIVERTAKIIDCDYDVEVCGWLDGYNNQGAQAAERIKEARAEVVLVALGNPIQEQWMAEYGKSTGASLTFGVGALFDFMSGDKARAPLLLRKLRLEWLYRVAQEPRRLARRYTLEMGYFFWLIFSFRAFGGTGPGGHVIKRARELG